MAVSYKKLWKLLIDRDMTKTMLRKEAGITTAALAKLGKNENVNTEVLVKICNTLKCDISDIMQAILRLPQHRRIKLWKCSARRNACLMEQRSQSRIMYTR